MRKYLFVFALVLILAGALIFGFSILGSSHTVVEFYSGFGFILLLLGILLSFGMIIWKGVEEHRKK